jgi:hypothetical protein
MASRAWLQHAQNPDGTLGYLPGQPGALEPVLLGIAADVLVPPVQWLKSAWQSPCWEFLLLPAIMPDGFLSDPVLDWIEQSQSMPVEGVEGFDATLPGWSWVPGTAAWVEPTAFALLSLCRARPGSPRIKDGIRLLQDRQCQDGGWNYGNPSALSQNLSSTPLATGWAVLALVAAQQQDPTIQGMLKQAEPALSKALSMPGLPSLALTCLAARVLEKDPTPYLALLAQKLQPDGSAGGRCDWTALTLLSETQVLPFGLP